MILAAASGAVRIAEIELADVAVKVLLRTMLVDACHSAFENRVISLCRVRVDDFLGFVADIFALAVVDAVVAGEVVAELLILAGFVSHDRRLFGDVGLEDRNEVAGLGAIDMERANLAALAIDK